MGKIKIILILTLILLSNLTMAKRYVGGDEWSRPRVTKKLFQTLDTNTKSLVLRTAKVVNKIKRKIGTAFLYQEELEHYIFLTNYHVISGEKECSESSLLLINEGHNKIVAKCDGVISIGTIKSGSDYLYFRIKKSEKLNFLSKLPSLNTKFSNPVAGDPLVTVGFGGGKADLRRYDAKIAQDTDCIYLTGNMDIRFNKDKVRDVFFTACDAQSGDSGSAIMNRDTGEIIGLFFGVADQNRKNPLSTQEIWNNLGSDYLEFYTNSSMSIDLRAISLK
ncbi:trypsin-like peptidase domain-containing protein [Halobacteriovorax sp. XZX-3]|uniref:S1 family peptidase n=2 Tax=Halobacteriovorax TaxID=1652133 RepID=UPI003711CB81